MAFDNLSYTLYLTRAKEKIEMGIVCSYEDAIGLLKNVSSELDKYVINTELKHINDFFFCLSPFTPCSVLDKISWSVTQNYNFVTMLTISLMKTVVNYIV